MPLKRSYLVIWKKILVCRKRWREERFWPVLYKKNVKNIFLVLVTNTNDAEFSGPLSLSKCLESVRTDFFQNVSSLVHLRAELGGHGQEFGHELVSEADSDTRFFETSGTDSDTPVRPTLFAGLTLGFTLTARNLVKDRFLQRQRLGWRSHRLKI